MKILKIFGVVVGIHVAALVLIFASPGCSSANKSAPADTVIKKDDAPPASVSLPSAVSPVTIAGGDTSPVAAAPAFDPNAPATSSPATVRFSPTRPGTPAAGALETQPVADVTPASTYTVAKGDSLWTIAKKNHLSVSELAAANNLRASSTVHVGQKLIVPAGKVSGSSAKTATAVSASSAPAAERPSRAAADAGSGAVARANGESVKHIVKPGETLGAIARKYQVRVGEIATANNITDPAKIRPGMELIIPGWQAPATKSKSSRSTASSRQSEPAPSSAPTTAPSDQNVVTPAPEQELDSGLKAKSGDAPVIKVDEK